MDLTQKGMQRRRILHSEAAIVGGVAEQMRIVSKLPNERRLMCSYRFQSVHANTLRALRAYGPGAYFGLLLQQNHQYVSEEATNYDPWGFVPGCT